MVVKLRRTILTAAIGLLLMAMGATAVIAAQPDAMAQMKSLGDSILSVARDPACRNNAESCRTRLRAIVEQHWDTAEMARSALGVHWRNLSSDQQQQFTRLFAQLTEAIYLSRSNFAKAQRYADQIKVNYLAEIPQGDGYSQINTSVQLHPDDNPVSVDYRLRLDNGVWKVYDVIVANISLVGNYRNQFNRIINNRGYDSLVKALQQKVQQLQQQNT